jgi:hypothetical protein
MLAFVRGRIMIGMGAWLLGAGAATGGSLLAVSLIGQGMSGFASQPMTAAAVAAAARTDSDERASTSTSTTATASATSPVRRPSGTVIISAATPRASNRPSAAPGQSPSPDPTSASPTSTPGSGSGSVLTSQGGDVVASCQAAGAYLISWSPQQGYETDDVRRGPAAQALVTFESAANSVVMQVTCQGGVPQASSYEQSGDGHTDE